MAYLHCHSCDWSQDDFWYFTIKWKDLFCWKRRPFGYNPLSLIMEDLANYLYPRYIGMDSMWMKENGYKGTNIHSWVLLKRGLYFHTKRIFTQKWWSYKSFKKDYDNGAVCPSCGKRDFDID